MRWTTDYTPKKKISSNFFKEIPKLFRLFNWMYSAVAQLTIMTVLLGLLCTRNWTITEAIAVVPVAVTAAEHSLLPLVLNPSPMIFNY